MTGAATPANLVGIMCCTGQAVRTLFIGNQCILPNLIRYLTKAVLLSATLAIVALPSLGHAQSGSAGGSIGNDEKSLSGSRERAQPIKADEKTDKRRAARREKAAEAMAAAISTARGFSRRRHTLRQFLRYGGYLQWQNGGTIRHRSSQSERQRLWIGSAGSLRPCPAAFPAAADPAHSGDPMAVPEAGADQSNRCGSRRRAGNVAAVISLRRQANMNGANAAAGRTSSCADYRVCIDEARTGISTRA